MAQKLTRQDGKKYGRPVGVSKDGVDKAQRQSAIFHKRQDDKGRVCSGDIRGNSVITWRYGSSNICLACLACVFLSILRAQHVLASACVCFRFALICTAFTFALTFTFSLRMPTAEKLGNSRGG